MVQNMFFRSVLGIRFLVILLSIAPITFPFLSAQEQSITVLTEEWPPYNYIENGELKGFSVEIVQRIIHDLKADIAIEAYPGMRATLLLNTLPRAMFISMFRTHEREKKYNWIGPLVDASIYFYKKKGSNINISTMEDAKKVDLIASRQAGLVFNRLKAEGFKNLDDTSVNGESIYKKLLIGRCDLGISDSSMGVKYILKRLKYSTDSLVKTNVKVVDATLYIAANKAIPPPEIERWQKALDRLKVSGVYQEILKKYDK